MVVRSWRRPTSRTRRVPDQYYVIDCYHLCSDGCGFETRRVHQAAICHLGKTCGTLVATLPWCQGHAIENVLTITVLTRQAGGSNVDPAAYMRYQSPGLERLNMPLQAAIGTSSPQRQLTSHGIKSMKFWVQPRGLRWLGQARRTEREGSQCSSTALPQEGVRRAEPTGDGT